MHKVITQLSEIKLIGITARTSNAAEMNADTAKIGITMQRFFADKLQDKILNRKTPKKFFQFIQIMRVMLPGNILTFLEQKLLLLRIWIKNFQLLLFQYKLMQNLHPILIKCLKLLLICGKNMAYGCGNVRRGKSLYS